MQKILSRLSQSFLTVLLLTALGACSGGNGGPAGGGTATPPDPGNVLSGQDVDALLSGATVTAYAVNPNGTQGAEITSSTYGQYVTNPATTAANGDYSINVGTYTGPVLLISTGGVYTDTATGSTIDLATTDQTLEAILPGVSGPVTAQITPMTTMAAESVPTLTQLSPSTPLATVISNANALLSNYFGLSNILNTTILDLNSSDCASGANQDSINASLIFAGISQLASINHVASNDLVQALIEDVVSDGVFNGTANGTAILLNLDTGQGTIALSQIEAGALTGLAAAITSFADSSANACQVAVIGNLLTALANDPGLYVTPAAPSGVVATPGNGQITITWLPVAGANSYNVYVATESGVQSTATNLPGFASYLNVTSPYVLGNLSNGTPYYFVVTAVNGVTTFGTESPASTQVSATPSADLGASVTIDQSNPQSVSVNGTLTFTATVTGSSNPSVTWSVSPASGCGSIDASGTYTAPASPATCQVIATSVADPSAAASVTVNVTAPVTLVSIAVLPADATLAVGTTQQFVATGTYSNQTSANLTSQATWVSSNPTVATVGSASGTAGLATAVAAGTATISAEVAGVTGTTQLTVGSGTPTVVALSTGFLNSSCAILSNGNTMCWGWDSEGVLGDGNSVQAVSTPVLATNISASNPATAISMNSATCAVLSDGSIQCWGYNTYGSLGNGSTTSSLTPVITYPNTANNPAIQVSVGEYSACGLFHDGTISCWGSDQSSVEVGALGNGTSGYSLTPVLVSNITSANPATQISVGWGAACALLQDQTVDCWGSNYEGDLGDGTSTGPDTCSTDGPCSTVPVAVSNLSNVTAISVGGSNAACALKSDGTVWCWGANAYSQLGESPQSLSQADEPVQISGISTATAISVGNTSACALLSNGTVQCWGYILVNEVGGASQYTSQPTPVTVSNLSSATSITVGNGSACALLANGTVQCWGFNGDGNLGDGTTTDSTTPVQVIGLP